MKKTLLRALCLALCLLLPASALAEPLPWLKPFIDGGADAGSIQSVITFQMDADEALKLANAILDAQEQVYLDFANTMQDSETEEDKELWNAFIADGRQQINTQRAVWKTHAPAIAALLNETTVVISGGQNSALYTFAIGGAPWFTLGLTIGEDGGTVLTSDLFPAYGLLLPGQSSLSALLNGYDSNQDGLLQALAKLMQSFRARLPEWEDYPILSAVFDAYSQGLARLEAEGAARREGDALVYAVSAVSEKTNAAGLDSADALSQLFAARQLPLDEKANDLMDFFLRAQSAGQAAGADLEEPAEAALPVLGEDATDEEYSQALTAYYQRSRSFHSALERRYTLTEHEITCESSQTDVSSFHFDDSAGDAGTAQKLKERYELLTEDRDYSFTSGTAWRLTENTLEYHEMKEWEERIIAVDATAADEILVSYQNIAHTDNFDDITETISLRLARDENGQEWLIAMEGMNLPASLGDPVIAVRFNNAMTRMEEEVSFSGMEKPLLLLHGDKQPLEEARQEAVLSALTIASSGSQEAQGLYAQLRGVGVPRLVTLILTALPQDANPLMTPLLTVVRQLSQIGME